MRIPRASAPNFHSTPGNPRIPNAQKPVNLGQETMPTVGQTYGNDALPVPGTVHTQPVGNPSPITNWGPLPVHTNPIQPHTMSQPQAPSAAPPVAAPPITPDPHMISQAIARSLGSLNPFTGFADPNAGAARPAYANPSSRTQDPFQAFSSPFAGAARPATTLPRV